MAGIGTQISQQYLYPHYLLWRFEKSIQQQPVFILIEKNHPKEFQAYMANVKQSFRKSSDIKIISSYTSTLLNQIFNSHLEKAPNDPIELYLKSTVELYRYLYTKSPEAIVVLETGRQSTTLDLEQLSEDLVFESYLNRLLDAKKLIIEDSIKSPVEKWDHEKAKLELEKIYDALTQKFGAEIVKAVFVPSETVIPPRVSSIVILEFYDEILATGKQTAGDIMRYIGSLSASNRRTGS